ncbi:MAG: hypothetical protein JWR50_1101, partial [Mucilaginibacter sp.]|nr:hypothetical protein [Mucilaginibacter sp.]
DHYGRAMASYGTFITACGFEYHGPKGFIRFAPKWDKQNFKTPFTTAQSWGTYRQKETNGKQEHILELKYGSLQLQTISLEKWNADKLQKGVVMVGAKNIAADFKQQGNSVLVTLSKPIHIQTNESLRILI